MRMICAQFEVVWVQHPDQVLLFGGRLSIFVAFCPNLAMLCCSAVPADMHAATGSYIGMPAAGSPLPYQSQIDSLELEPLAVSDSSPGALLDIRNNSSPVQFVPDSQTRESACFDKQ